MIIFSFDPKQDTRANEDGERLVIPFHDKETACFSPFSCEIPVIIHLRSNWYYFMKQNNST